MPALPEYAYPAAALTGLIRDILLGRQRSFRDDGIACLRHLRPPLRLLGAEHIPSTGPCVVTVNHYARPGFNAWWIALAVAGTVPVEMHWLMTAELTFPGRWYGPLGRPISRGLIRRFSHSYGFTTMPPMPPRPQEVRARAAAVRRVYSHLKKHPRTILGLAPEGMDMPGGALAWPPPGVGRFTLLLADLGLPFVPAGLYEAEGALTLSYGPAYRLQVPDGLGGVEKERRAAAAVMNAIAGQLPAHLQGQFPVVRLGPS
ncbi:MAG: hypothetical protein JXB85_08530 [Anaerolineales bacterium]|nr:hypothetical protein [Anaerolineales bacterium]